MLKSLYIFLGLGVLLVVLLVGCKSTRAGYESPKYRVVAKDKKFEVRDYPALVVAETPMAKEGEGMNGGFNNLFRFITGSNSKQEKIAMTTPVLVNNGSSNASMAFVMPNKYELADLPQPANERVRLRKVEAGRYAVLRFSGSRTEKGQEKAKTALVAWLNTKTYEPLSEAQFAYYDPPWIPGFLRRNEVLVQVKVD